MMPTQRPPSLTTGTPLRSWSRITCSTVSTESATVTLTGSSSMMSRTVSAMGAQLRGWLDGERGGELLDDVGGDHAVRAVRLGGEAAGADVREHGRARGVRRRQALGQQRAGDAGQHVAGTGRGERRGAAA